MRVSRTKILATVVLGLLLAGAPAQADMAPPPPPPPASGGVSGGGSGSGFAAGGWAAVGIIVVAGVLCAYDIGQKIAGEKKWGIPLPNEAPPDMTYSSQWYWKH